MSDRPILVALLREIRESNMALESRLSEILGSHRPTMGTIDADTHADDFKDFDILTVDQAAQIVGMRPTTIRKWAKDGGDKGIGRKRGLKVWDISRARLRRFAGRG